MTTVTILSKQNMCGSLVFLCLAFFAQPAFAEVDISGQANILADKLTSIKKGEVLDGSDTDVYINIGEKQGIVPGARFEIFRRGEPLKVNNNIVGYKESKVALVKVDRIRENVSNCSVLVKKETPKSGDKAYELRAPIKRLVVAQFSYNQSYNQFTKNLQEKLFASFINKGMQVVERDQLEKVLAEQQLGYSGLVNIESAKKIGELLGAEAMLLGSVSDLSDSISLNARLVDLGTGDSLTAAETSMPKTPQIVDLLSNPVEEKPYVISGGRSKPTKSRPSSKATAQAGDVTIRINSIVSKGKGGYQVLGRAVNNSDSDQWVLFMGHAKLLSQNGNYADVRSSVGINDCSYKASGRKWYYELRKCGDRYKESYVSLKPGLARNFSINYKGEGGALESPAEVSFGIVIRKEDKYKKHEVYLSDLPIQKKDDDK